MSRRLPSQWAPPDYYQLADQVIEHLGALNPTLIEARAPLVRAAWNLPSVLPERVTRCYRFGPPEALLGPRGGMPFWWLYLAEQPMTAIFEAGFCAQDARHQGRFYIVPAAEGAGLIATVSFARPLRLSDLTGSLGSQLSLYDRISSPDHAWCQWFGAHLDRLLFSRPGARFDGLRYPSRKHRNAAAIALSSRLLGRLRRGARTSVVQFSETPEHRELKASPWLIRAPGT